MATTKLSTTIAGIVAGATGATGPTGATGATGASGATTTISNGTSNLNIATSGGEITANTAGSERMRIDSTGKVVVGNTTTLPSPVAYPLQVVGSGSMGMTLSRFDANVTAPIAAFAKSRNATVGAFGTIVNSGDALGDLRFYGDDGVTAIEAARISAQVDGTPGTSDMPGRLVFSTTADGASTPTERMRITSATSENILFGLSASQGTGVFSRLAILPLPHILLMRLLHLNEKHLGS
jgi:hypothetical protein